jgi:hypothetical protein
MANTDTPFGARVIGTHGGCYEGQLTRMFIPATDGTATFINDVVKLAGSADENGVATVAQAAATDMPCGIIVAMEPVYGSLETIHRLASTARYVWVNTNPNVRFEIQSAGIPTAGNIGLNADLVVGSGSTISGLSAMEVSSSMATTSTLVLAIEGLFRRPNNQPGTNANLLCSFNVHQYGSVGVAGT